MKKQDIFGITIIAIIIVGAIALGTWFGNRGSTKLGDSGNYVFYTNPTQATSSVGIYAPVNILANSGSRQYANICNTSSSSTNDLLLEFDATSSATGLNNPPGMLVPGNSCYEMTNSKLFTGNLYGIFTISTATVETLVK